MLSASSPRSDGDIELGSISPSIAAAVQRKKQFFTVGGMTCAACSGTIERALQSTKGIYSAKISLLTERCEVVFDTSVIQTKDILNEIEDVGFEASVSNSSAKGKISLAAEQRLTAQQKELVYKSLMELSGVVNVEFIQRSIPPFEDVIQVEFDADQHELSGPGGSKPVVWQGPVPNTPTNASSSSSSSATALTDTLGRFSIRSAVSLLQSLSINIRTVRNDGDLESRKAELKYRQDSELRNWKKAFLHSLVFTIPIATICWILPFIPPIGDSLLQPVHKALTVKALILWLLVTPVQFGFGLRFYRNAYKALKHKSANMDVLVALGSSAAYFYSLIVCIMCLSNDHYEGNVFFETSALLISIVLLGRYVENMAKGRTSDALSVLMGLQASTATLLTVHPVTQELISEEEIDVNLVQKDDLLKVHRGGKIPVDGILVSETATSVDESLLTGESMPVVKKKGESLIGGTLNLEVPIRIRATGVGSDTVLFKIVSLVNDAQNSKAPIQAYADYIGSIFVPAVVALAFLVFCFWYVLCITGVIPDNWKGAHESSFLFSFLFSVSVLLISCPCSLGLATPTAVMVGTGVGASLGVLFKGGEPLEVTGQARVVVLDKTGTITQGKPSVNIEDTSILALDQIQVSMEVWWLLVGSLAHQSEHLMSRAIAFHALTSKGTSSPAGVFETVDKFDALAGGGCAGTVRGKRVVLGNAKWLQQNGIELSAQQLERMEAVQTRGNIAVLIAIDSHLTGIISICDAVKPEAGQAIRALQARGIEVYMLTGDNARSAQAVGKQVGIPESNVISQVSPAQKAEVIERIQASLAGNKKKDDASGRDVELGGQLSIAVPSTSSFKVNLSPTVSPLTSSSLLGDSSASPIASPQSDEDDFEGNGSQPVANELNSSRPIVLFVGDGYNDACALAKADVGIAIGSGTDIALETAQVVLMKNDLTDVLTAIDLSQATLKRIRRNFTWASIYNILSIPVAAGCFFPLVHVTLPPILAAACMGMSSISVIASSLLLKKYKKPILADEVGVPVNPAPSTFRLKARLGALTSSLTSSSSSDSYAFQKVPNSEHSSSLRHDDASPSSLVTTNIR